MNQAHILLGESLTPTLPEISPELIDGAVNAALCFTVSNFEHFLRQSRGKLALFAALGLADGSDQLTDLEAGVLRGVMRKLAQAEFKSSVHTREETQDASES